MPKAAYACHAFVLERMARICWVKAASRNPSLALRAGESPMNSCRSHLKSIFPFFISVFMLSFFASSAWAFAPDPGGEPRLPNLVWITPFVVMLLCIAVLPLLPHAHHWWERNWTKLGVALFLGLITTLYYLIRPFGMLHADSAGTKHLTTPGVETLAVMLDQAIIDDYLPFLILLFSLYVITGGILVRIGAPPTPRTNAAILLIGALAASFIGTTGAAMLLIRPLLEVNRGRRHVAHTIVFFIFLVGNIGGCLTPLGDPPLFLGYLRDVPFLWTFKLWPEWLFSIIVLLLIYYFLDARFARREDRLVFKPIPNRAALELNGGINFLWLLGVIAAVGCLTGGKPFPGTTWIVPPLLREGILLALSALSWVTTPKGVRRANQFNFNAIAEVGSIFIGIFICMQVPMEILQERGRELGLSKPWEFFWATGLLSSFLDNAPTYAVFFETAGNFGGEYGPVIVGVKSMNQTIPEVLLRAVSLGAVLMGANTYIGNGPNFMIKSIAEENGVKMPSFFVYILYSGAVLIPLFVVITLIWMR